MNTLTLLICIIFFFALIETPMFTVIAGLSIVCLFFVNFDITSLQMIIIEINRLSSMPILVALPLFTFTGCLLSETKSPTRIMNFMQSMIGWVPGGLAISGLLACDFFTALTGASGVTVVALGGVLYPILMKQKYSEKFTLGLIATSGSIGLLLPPSLPIILYGIVAQVNISQIFLAALLPGFLLILVISFYAFLNQYFNKNYIPFKFKEKKSYKKVFTSFTEAKWDLPIAVIIIIGVFGGYVTISEVSALVLVYVVIVECFILKEIKFFQDLPSLIIESTVLSGAIIIILSVALGFTGYLVDEQIPNRILNYLTGLTQNKYLFLAGLNILLLFVGCIMDIFSAIIIIVPIIVPVALKYGIHPIHLSIIFLVNLEIGFSTPPIGINLFITSLKFDKPITTIYRASVPYLILLFIVLVIVTYIPAISLCFIQ